MVLHEDIKNPSSFPWCLHGFPICIFDLFLTTSVLRCFCVSSERLALLRGKPVEKASGAGKPVVGAVEMDHDFLNSRGLNVDGWLSGLWQLKYVLFSPRKVGKMNPLWRAYFSETGWFNHQPVTVYNYSIPGALKWRMAVLIGGNSRAFWRVVFLPKNRGLEGPGSRCIVRSLGAFFWGDLFL